MMGRRPVFGRLDLVHASLLAQPAQAFIDQVPGAVNFFTDLTLTILGAATGAVQHTFRTAGNGANTQGQVENAISTTQAVFRPDTLLQRVPQELGI